MCFDCGPLRHKWLGERYVVTLKHNINILKNKIVLILFILLLDDDKLYKFVYT